nr:EOG090X0491 [Polyphemus pediculus]
MAEHDLTSILGTYLDRHLVFPLFEFLAVQGIYQENELLRAKLDLLSKTNMVDFAMDVHKNLYPDQEIPPHLKDKRSVVVEQLKRMQSETEPILAMFMNPEVTRLINSAKESKPILELLTREHGLKPEMLDKLYLFAKFQYECGNYSGAAEYLYFHRFLVPSTDKNYLNGLWGKLASEILMQNWDIALEDLVRLRDFIDAPNTFSSSLELLQQRTWLIHWSLFIYFNHAKGRDMIIDMLLYKSDYLQAIETMCPHILRYLTTAVIISKQNRRAMLKDLVKVIQQESYAYRDPITEFIEHLYVNFDFDAAQQKLRQCKDVLLNDFFLVAVLDDFIENARLMIFETFCRIHQCISIKMLAEKLNMTAEDAERWIVNLIRNARLDAKIDSQQGHVVMATQTVSPYQQLIDKTKTLTVRSQKLASDIEKKIGQRNPEASQWGNNDF